MAYCIVGIPIVFCFVALLAESLSNWNTLLVSNMLRHCLKVDVDTAAGHRMVVCTNLLALTTFLVAMVILSSFLVLNGASNFSDALYLVVITYTTVGYGLPELRWRSHIWLNSAHPASFILTIVYIMIEHGGRDIAEGAHGGPIHSWKGTEA